MTDRYSCEPWMETATGVKFDLINPTPDMVNLEDIATALSLVCRFGGHLKRFYSIAEHSMMVASGVTNKNKKVALFHDAPEAYIGDCIRPLKVALGDSYKEIESKIWRAICMRFDIQEEIPDEVKISDNRALMTEADQLKVRYQDWGHLENYPRFPVQIEPVIHPEIAKSAFIAMANDLGVR